MDQMTKLPPVVRKLEVPASPEQAFSVFVANMGIWWPRDHSILDGTRRDVVIEPKKGGRWYEIAEDGTTCDWGHVLAWQPGERLLLAWQLNAEWVFDPDLITELEVTFVATGETTLVTLEHRDIERMGAKAQEVHTSISSDGGWTGILASYGECVAS